MTSRIVRTKRSSAIDGGLDGRVAAARSAHGSVRALRPTALEAEAPTIAAARVSAPEPDPRPTHVRTPALLPAEPNRTLDRAFGVSAALVAAGLLGGLVMLSRSAHHAAAPGLERAPAVAASVPAAPAPIAPAATAGRTSTEAPRVATGTGTGASRPSTPELPCAGRSCADPAPAR